MTTEKGRPERKRRTGKDTQADGTESEPTQKDVGEIVPNLDDAGAQG